MDFKTILNRLKNVGTITSLVSASILILTVLGVRVNNDKVMTLVQIICSAGVALGILNNPDTPGLDLPGKSQEIDNLQ